LSKRKKYFFATKVFFGERMRGGVFTGNDSDLANRSPMPPSITEEAAERVEAA